MPHLVVVMRVPDAYLCSRIRLLVEDNPTQALKTIYIQGSDLSLQYPC